MSDANGLRFHMLAAGEDWLVGEPRDVRWDPRRRSLRLVSRRALPTPAGGAPATELVDRVLQALDGFGSRAFWDESARVIRVVSEGLPGSVDVFEPPEDETPTDLAVSREGVLYVAMSGAVTLVDLRDRWDPVRVEAVGEFEAWRLAVDSGSDATVDVWVLDRVHRRIGKLRGTPFPRRPAARFSGGTWRPRPENPDPPTLLPAVELGDAGFEADEIAVALAASPAGELAVLSWTEGAQGLGRLHLVAPTRATADLGLDAERALAFPHSVAWLDDDLLAVLVPGLQEAAVYRASDLRLPDTATLGTGTLDTSTGETGTLAPVGDVFPMHGHDGGPFLNGLSQPPHYPTVPAQDDGQGSIPLHRLSLPSFVTRGEATSGEPPIDAGRDGAVWHRLYLEAAIPRHCSVQVLLAASDLRPDDPRAGEPAWFTHHFGAGSPGDDTPRGVWVDENSEIPFAPPLLACEPVKNRAGLFTVLVQRTGRKVRSLRGRYLSVRVVLTGNGRRTPEVAAVRAYGSRFSYVENYLPQLYHETLFGPAGDEEGDSTPADFLERLVDNFEGVLTPLEDRIANAHLLTDPATVPADSLAWLGSWIGVVFEPAMEEERRRALLRAAPELQRRQGTPRGLALALDVATKGAVSGGEIVILEGFRLRRTFATILGADLADLEDPLLPGLSVSGNSFVGDTLILGEEQRAEFLSLFRADLPLDSREEAAVAAFFERLAYRVTVLVHQEVEPQDLGLVSRVAEVAAPAHVEVQVLQASLPLLVGIASLVGVDTYLGPKPLLRPVELGRSHLGGGDRIQRPPVLDPRVSGGSSSTQEANS